jgi:hypothetical protein
MMGEPIPERDQAAREIVAAAGNMDMRVVATLPATAGMFRFDQLVTALARKRLWLTDAYYAGVAAYVQALRAAARDGVEVRLLVPNATDIPLLRPLSRAGYRPLLEAGVRVFEWNGTMVHAKMPRRSCWTRNRECAPQGNPVIRIRWSQAAPEVRVGQRRGQFASAILLVPHSPTAGFWNQLRRIRRSLLA